MISAVKGKIEDIRENLIVVDAGAVSFELIATTSAVMKHQTTPSDEVVKIETYMNVREDAIQLFAFENESEKKLFLQLITVSGVGPKLAITILSGMETEKLCLAIATANLQSLSSIKGLGKKTAEKIIVELKEKIGKIDKNELSSLSTSTSIENTEEIEDAVVALCSLGMNRPEVLKIIDKVAEKTDKAEDIIRKALKYLAK